MKDDAGGVSASNEGLGPLPERRVRHVYNEAKGYVCDAWTEEAVRAYALGEVRRAVAAERKRCAQLCQEARTDFAPDANADKFSHGFRSACALIKQAVERGPNA